MKSATVSNKSGSRRNAKAPQRAMAKTQPFQIHSILVPVDFSLPSREAIAFSLPLVQRFGAELHLVHVIPSDEFLSSTAALPLILPQIEIGRDIHKRLKDAAKEHSIELRPSNIHALKGHPFEEICRLARDLKSDLIITATRGNTGLKRLRLGSTAERVVRYSPCPVLVVPDKDGEDKTTPKQKAKRATAFKKILAPIDFSDCSIKGLTYARALAKEFGASLLLLHSLHVQYYVSNDEYARYDFPLLMQQAEKAAREQMQELVQKTDWGGIKVEQSLQMGHPGDQVCAQAKASGADLIVTSTHGTTGLKHILLGSTAEYIVRHASCPVLVVPGYERSLPSSKETMR